MAAIWGDDPSEIAVLEQSPEAAHQNDEKSFGSDQLEGQIEDRREK